MKISIIAISIVFGLFVWVFDSLLDYFIFYEGSFFDLLIFNVPPHEIYIWGVIMASFIIFGIIVSRILLRLESANKKIQTTKNYLNVILDNINDFILYIDTDFNILSANKLTVPMIGKKTRDDLINRKCYEVL